MVLEANSEVKTMHLKMLQIHSQMSLIVVPDMPKDLMRALIAMGLWLPLRAMRYTTRLETWEVA